MNVEIIDYVPENEWKQFLDGRGDTTLYHTPEWKTFLEKTFDYKSRYLFAIDGGGQLVGMLPLFLVRSKLTGDRISSVPFSHECGPIGDSEAINSLLEYELALFDLSGAHYLEVRDMVNHNRFETLNSFSKYVLDLSVGHDQVWKNLSKNVRRGIQKSQNSGVTVHATQNIEDLKSFYELNCVTKRNIGVPAHPWKFFKNMFVYLGDYVRLFIAKYDGEVIGGGVREYYASSVTAGYAASNPDYSRFNTYNAINWASIVDALQRGYTSYDLGRVSYDNQGLEFFKKRWGTVEKKLYYSYYPRNPVTLSGNRTSLKYRVATKTIQKMPLFLHKALSERVFRHYG